MGHRSKCAAARQDGRRGPLKATGKGPSEVTKGYRGGQRGTEAHEATPMRPRGPAVMGAKGRSDEPDWLGLEEARRGLVKGGLGELSDELEKLPWIMSEGPEVESVSKDALPIARAL